MSEQLTLPSHDADILSMSPTGSSDSTELPSGPPLLQYPSEAINLPTRRERKQEVSSLTEYAAQRARDEADLLDSFRRSVSSGLLSKYLDEVLPHVEDSNLPSYPNGAKLTVEPHQLPTGKSHKLLALQLAGLTALMGVGQYIHGVEAGRIAHESDVVQTKHVFDVDPNAPAFAQDIVIYDFEGTSGRDASEAASHETSYRQIGDLEAMVYGRDFSPGPMARAIVQRMQELGKHTIILSGRSAGAPILLSVAVELERLIHEEGLDLRISTLLLDSPAGGLDSVNPDRLALIDKLKWAEAHIWGVGDSQDLNAIGQTIAELYAHPQKLATNGVMDYIFLYATKHTEASSSAKASPFLIAQEVDAISAARIEDNMSALGELPDVEKPIIIGFQPADQANDQNIVSDVAAKEYLDNGRKSKLQVFIERIKGIYHGNPGFTPGEWNIGIETQVAPIVQQHENTMFLLRLSRNLSRVLSYLPIPHAAPQIALAAEPPLTSPSTPHPPR